MASLNTSFHINGAALESMLNGPNGPVAHELQRRGERIAARQRELAPKRTGNLASNIRSALVVSNGKIEARSGVFGRSTRAARYVKYVVHGTRTPIRPRRARVLVFRSRGKVWYLHEVRGQEANDFLTRAMEAGRG